VHGHSGLLESGDDPVFVFSGILQRKEDQDKADNSVELKNNNTKYLIQQFKMIYYS
jgi:hypothetical protein